MSLCRAIHAEGVIDDTGKNTAFVEEVEKLLERLAIPLDTPLSANNPNKTKSKLLLCVSNKTNMGTTYLRNYSTGINVPSNVSIIEALIATFTDSLMRAGTGNSQEEYGSDSSDTNNPTLDAISEAHAVYGSQFNNTCVLNIGKRHGKQAATPANGTVYANELAEFLVGANGDEIKNETASKTEHPGHYFRFCIARRPSQSAHTDASIGDVESTTLAYLEEASISDAVDNCVSKLQAKIEYGLPLPKLTSHFVMRENPWYQYICFIDGSSVASIEEDLVASILSIDRQQGQMTLEQALQWFVRKQNWLIVFDNVDSPLDIRSFFPQCNHGSILITTRNRTLGQVSPDTHYRLRGMTNEEAKKALLLIALPPGTIASPLDLKYAQDIVAELGNLPVAIVHAGRFILERNCLAQYLTHFRASRAEMLSRPAHYKVDDYHKSVYAALETIRSELSNQSLKALHLFSYFHYTNIPHITIRKATESRYSFEIANYLDRSLESSPAAVLLTDILGNVEKLGEILIGLQARSLVEMDWVSGQKVIRLHPVVQTWAQDELMFEDAQTYREAVVRILSTCAGKEDRFIHRFLLPHIRKLSPYWSSMHPNDKAAFAAVLWAYSPNRSIQLLEEVHERVKLSSKMDEGIIIQETFMKLSL
ncbi:hypothetical protein M408DRAFT_6489 [Serendipita vermifera MAFF 305830]|uniref:NB-ARC domain-containing protein n=1 Tax=Serendipita vermifera MAFF 305830 TaxID=933852 RepID=A0A0C3BL40_SERVB|nr:hypothetical protein M408DRAFT_6489 [Serendipita vermifera MAFF 305830]